MSGKIKEAVCLSLFLQRHFVCLCFCKGSLFVFVLQRQSVCLCFVQTMDVPETENSAPGKPCVRPNICSRSLQGLSMEFVQRRSVLGSICPQPLVRAAESILPPAKPNAVVKTSGHFAFHTCILWPPADIFTPTYPLKFNWNSTQNNQRCYMLNSQGEFEYVRIASLLRPHHTKDFHINVFHLRSVVRKRKRPCR